MFCVHSYKRKILKCNRCPRQLNTDYSFLFISSHHKNLPCCVYLFFVFVFVIIPVLLYTVQCECEAHCHTHRGPDMSMNCSHSTTSQTHTHIGKVTYSPSTKLFSFSPLCVFSQLIQVQYFFSCKGVSMCYASTSCCCHLLINHISKINELLYTI